MVAAGRGTMASVRRLFAWTAGLVGIAALARFLARRERSRSAVTAPLPEQDPAEELRRKLSESRPERAATQEPMVAPEPPAEPPESLEERRARVHAKAEAAMAEMQESPPA